MGVDIYDPFDPTDDPLNNEKAGWYFFWLASIVKSPCLALLYRMFHIEFRAYNESDRTLALRALDLRSKFGKPEVLQSCMNNMGATVLEVLISLALSMAEICWDNDERPDVYFKILINNLGIYEKDFDDVLFTYDRLLFLHKVLDRWMDRRVGPNGEGSPFVFTGRRISGREDVRDSSWWTVMQRYCEEEL